MKGKNPFKDRRVREAMSLAIDREAIKRSLMRGLSIPAAIMVAPVAYGWSAELDTVAKPDVTRAKQLCVVVGSMRALKVALANTDGTSRQTGLLSRIRAFARLN